MRQRLEGEIKKRLQLLCEGEDLRFDEPMRGHTSFRVGGEADAWILVQDASKAKELLIFLEKEKVPYFITGNGTNLLVADQGYRGVILCTAGQR
ncbi:MAG: UDP-N-acetylenolpyruvoylglucosamine reductase, partial [Lachnospiraceae bacterium]|nr:UDP-N-acetylenolpyruvoylglucosamine reductase [Lachnospiraceae bacterium]